LVYGIPSLADHSGVTVVYINYRISGFTRSDEPVIEDDHYSAHWFLLVLQSMIFILGAGFGVIGFYLALREYRG
jgi:hypothetical protein